MTKQWGNKDFWGVGSKFDPDWLLDDTQLQLREKLIQLCKSKIRPIAIESDKNYEYPREALNAMGEIGLLSLIVPKELDGLGQSHVCAAMIVETLARYGCPSTAMIYSMHLQAISILLFRYHENNEIKSLLRRLSADKLIGASSYSDASTGSHFWFQLTAKAQKIDDESYKLFKFSSWTTSAGFADFYVFQTPTPSSQKDYSNLSTFFALKNEVRASSESWSALGLHGNQSGPVIIEGVYNKDRMIGNEGDGGKTNKEVATIFFLLCTSACWNGLAMGCIDVTKKHVCTKSHGDSGARVCDYPIVQDYVGGSISSSNNCRGFLYMLAKQMDEKTNNNDWSLHNDPHFIPRSAFGLWMMQAKHNCSENVSTVAEKMIRACGGDGYKTQTGIERLLRDSKAGCLMASTNEIIRNLIGKGALKGLVAIDIWHQTANLQVINHEVERLTLKEKKRLLSHLAEEVRIEENGIAINHPHQDTDFDNPFSICSPKCVPNYQEKDGTLHAAALNPDEWTPLMLKEKQNLQPMMSSFVFALPNLTDHTGCLVGQYVQVQVKSGNKFHERYFSPVSLPNSFGRIELVLKFETHGIFSNIFKELEVGDSVDFRGPCGGFEYSANNLGHLTILASGGGITPGIQLIRAIAENPEDETQITLLNYSENYESILYQTELQNLSECKVNLLLNDITERKKSPLKLVNTLGEPPSDWTGEEGFIDLRLIDKYVIKPNEVHHQIIICGGPSMSITCLHALRALNFPSNMIFIYGQFGTEQIRAVFGKNAKLSSHSCVPIN